MRDVIAKLPKVDLRPEVTKLLETIRRRRRQLTALLKKCSNHWGYEDPVYRFYHQSFKVYGIQDQTTEIVTERQALAPERPLNDWFLTIVRAGTGVTFEPAHNGRWLDMTRPMLEAFFHARYFLEMVVRYSILKRAPAMLPSGWASVLYLFNLR